MNSSEIQYSLYEPHHYASLKALMNICFADIDDNYATEEEIALMARLYPRGQIVALHGDKVVGANLARVVPFERYALPHTQADCIDGSRFVSDCIHGDSVYGLDVFVHPDYQNMKLGKEIVAMLVRHTFEDNFKCMMGICRVVNFPQYMHEMDCATYAAKVATKELYDPCLSFHIRNGMQYVNVSPEFSPNDTASAGHGVIMAIYNPAFDALKPISPARQQLETTFAVA